MNKKNVQKENIGLLLNRFMSNTETPNFNLVIMKYDTDEFYSCNETVGEYFKILTNSLSKVNGLTNREWYKNEVRNFFYKTDETLDTITIYVGLEPYNELDIIDLESRILRIKPFPIEINITHNDFDILNNDFSKILNLVTNMSIFGEIKSKIHMILNLDSKK